MDDRPGGRTPPEVQKALTEIRRHHAITNEGDPMSVEQQWEALLRVARVEATRPGESLSGFEVPRQEAPVLPGALASYAKPSRVNRRNDPSHMMDDCYTFGDASPGEVETPAAPAPTPRSLPPPPRY